MLKRDSTATSRPAYSHDYTCLTHDYNICCAHHCLLYYDLKFALDRSHFVREVNMIGKCRNNRRQPKSIDCIGSQRECIMIQCVTVLAKVGETQANQGRAIALRR